MNKPLKAFEAEALVYVFSAEGRASVAAGTARWRRWLRGHALMVSVIAGMALLGTLLWRLLPG